MTTAGKEYKYDIAFSLCKQDVEFARKIIDLLNPTLKVFFYEYKQEELIGKSGPEAFGRIFKEESRIVVILSRNEWSESYYTDIERNAIIDRTSVRNEGYGFLMVIPMAPNELPVWYPPTRIYANSQRFPIEELVKFIEFKVTEEGGSIKELTLEERHKHLLLRINDKRRLVQLQTSKVAMDSINLELDKLKDIVENKKAIFTSAQFWDTLEQTCGLPAEFYFGIDKYLLELKVPRPDETYQRIVSTQDYSLTVQLYSVVGTLNQYYGNPEGKKLVLEGHYKYLYGESSSGWCSPLLVRENVAGKEASIMFRVRDPQKLKVTYWYYDLKNPMRLENLVDTWFHELLRRASNSIEQLV